MGGYGRRVERARVDCVGGIVTDRAGRLLMIQRGNEPAKGLWSIPGGKVEAGESDAAATAREVLEETGLRVSVGPYAGSVERDAPDGSAFVIRDYLCRLLDDADASDVRAASDADAAGWFTPDEVRVLACVPGLVEALESWGVLPTGSG